jgi:hypothetical protein
MAWEPVVAESTYETIVIGSWKEFQEAVTGPAFRAWAFRGQSDAGWQLFSTLSRYLRGFRVHPDAWPVVEERTLRIFRRKSHLFLEHLPAEGDSFEWLALMQHHGAPTRLLDFTWSPYVAIFFALEKATTDAAVWAIFPPDLSKQMVRTVRASQKDGPDEVGPWVPGNYEKHFLPNKERIVSIGEPHRMNQRLIAQSGTLLMPGLLNEPVEEIAPSHSVKKLKLLTHHLRREAMLDLYRMNVNNASLFPGLDGLSRSLAYELEYHWAFDPLTMEKYKGFSLD